MSTDKTLADVQPGGRVRLGDQALRVFSAGRWTYDGTGQAFSHEEMDAAAFVVYRDAALSAQPSPGGQGGALLEQVARFLDYSVGHDPWPNIRRVYGDAWWEPVRKMRDDLRALAARQPGRQVHGEESCEEIEAELQFYREEAFNLPNILIGAGVFSVDHDGNYKAAWANIIAAIERLVARQPVGEDHLREAIATVCEGWTLPADARKILEKAMWEYVPPAQAVDLDLGQFRRPIEEWRSDMEKWVKEHGDYDGVFAKDIAEANRLLALIDSQAVGK